MVDSSRMNPVERMKYTEKVRTKILSVLEEKGPLNFEALHYFTQKDFEEYLVEDDFKYALSMARGTGEIPYNTKQGLYVLATDPDAEPKLPSPKNFTEAYYSLLERYQIVLASSDFKDAPEEWLEKIFPPII